MHIHKPFKTFRWLLILFVATFSQGCNEEVPIFPIIESSLIEATTDGALIRVKIENYRLENAVSMGLLWSRSTENLTFEEGLSIQLQASDFNNGETTALISTLRRDANYRLRAYIETSNNTFYSPIVNFLSQGSKPPVLERLAPTTGSSGDTISIIVKESGIDPEANEVGFNESFGEIIEKNDSLWRVIIPSLSRNDPFFDTGEVAVFVTKYNLKSNLLPFQLQNLNLTSTLPEMVKPGELLSLTGDGFVQSRTSVTFGGLEVDMTFETENLISIRVPSLFESATGTFKVTVGVASRETNEVMIAAPEFDESSFDQVIGPGLPIAITGENLNNPNLEILINDVEASILSRENGRIDLIVPESLCAETTDFKAKIRLEEKQVASDLPFAQPIISAINVLQVKYGGEVEVSYRYIPTRQNLITYINGQRVSRQGSSGINNGELTMTYEIPRDLLLNDAGDLDFTVEICGKSITESQFAQIPAPEITEVETVNPYQITGVKGSGFSGARKVIYINNEQREVTFSSSNNSLDRSLSFVLGTESNGTFELALEINGRRSENVSITVENLWSTIGRLSDATTVPQSDEIHPVAFLNGDELYVGGGFDGFTAFHALDLNTGNWTRKADTPLQTGGSSNNESTGYLLYQQQFYRYDFALDTWEKLPDQENMNSPSISGYSSFMSDDRFFISSGCLVLYYYDPSLNTWQKITGGSNDGCSNAVTFTSQTGERYVYNYRTIETFDPSNLTYTGGWSLGFSDFGYRNSSLQGFEYEGNLILIDNHRLTVTAVGGRTNRSFRLPDYMNNPKLFRRGNEAIVVSEGIVWAFDLTAI